MSLRNLEQGIALIQQGNRDEGARMIKIALKSDELQGGVRATALLWLAEATMDRQEKLSLYQQALNHDPDNAHAKTQITQLFATGLQQTPPPQQGGQPYHQQPTQPQQTFFPQQTPAAGYPAQQVNPQMPGQQEYGQGQQPVQQGGYGNFSQQSAAPYQQNPIGMGNPPGYPTQTAMPQQSTGFYRTAGIAGGPNGNGTGFFVTKDGLLATTRKIVGNEENVTVHLEQGRQIAGRVVRSFPELDLAFIATGLQLSQILPASAAETIAADTPLVALSHNGYTISGQRRATRNEMKAAWFPTTISKYDLVDVGGNPIFDERNLLIGMLTANTSRTSDYVFGLKINVIYQVAEQYLREAQQYGQNQVYCPACGTLSRAGAAGAYYCETCGFTLPHAQNIRRYQMPQMLAFYTSSQERPCRNCGAQVGYKATGPDRGKCLRCGQ